MAKKKTIAFHTFGCKLNFAETSTIARNLSSTDYEVTDIREKPDIYVIHSCTVTRAAEKKCNQYIRHLKRENPESAIVVMGCYSQLNREKLKTMPEVDLVLGNAEKFHLAQYLERGLPVISSAEERSFEKDGNIYIPSYSLGDRTRSFLKIQDGCDYFCTYCTIPMARGRSRSAPVREILREAQKIAESGVNEVVLTGVNIGDFGKQHRESLYDLLEQMDQHVSIPRIRISSIEPDLLENRIIELIAGASRLMPHFHIPLQSGSNRILKRMKRKYTRELFADRVDLIRKIIPDACIAADVIVGFPGETEEDIHETARFSERTDISYMHVFTYSERPGTLAAGFEDKVPMETRKERSKLLHQISEQKKHHFYTRHQGNTFHVLFESDPHKSTLFGFTENYIQVKTHFSPNLINQIIPVRLEKLHTEDGIYYYL